MAEPFEPDSLTPKPMFFPETEGAASHPLPLSSPLSVSLTLILSARVDTQRLLMNSAKQASISL
jgi:hypothetical protein